MQLPWVMVAVLAVTTFIHYLDRNNLAIVLPEIARSFGWSDQQVGAYGSGFWGPFMRLSGWFRFFSVHLRSGGVCGGAFWHRWWASQGLRFFFIR
jgi:hypothetical protein